MRGSRSANSYTANGPRSRAKPGMTMQAGFTLIELSIVLVIVGLVVGGIVVGREMIDVAKTRSQISQIQNFQTATTIFREKYGGTPGDLAFNKASQFGFTTFSCANGNDRLEDHTLCSGQKTYGQGGCSGEVLLFWTQLSAAGLIEGNYIGTSTTPTVSGSDLFNYVPKSRIENLPVIAVNAMPYGNSSLADVMGKRYFNLVNVSSCSSGWGFWGSVQPEWYALHPLLAFNIDSKMDDGNPLAGKVRTLNISSGAQDFIAVISAGSNSGRCVTAGGAYNTNMQPFDYYGTTLNKSCALGFEF